MSSILITKDILNEVVDVLANDIDYDMHKEYFIYNAQDEGAKKEYLERLALSVVNKYKVEDRFIFESIAELEKKYDMKASDEFKAGFKIARSVITSTGDDI
jgi:hypothetical protein